MTDPVSYSWVLCAWVSVDNKCLFGYHDGEILEAPIPYFGALENTFAKDSLTSVSPEFPNCSGQGSNSRVRGGG